MRFILDVRIIGGGLQVLSGTASSSVFSSIPEESVSIVARRGAKKLRVVFLGKEVTAIMPF
jgi:hypothetical protein